jgi:hypothetical protein
MELQLLFETDFDVENLGVRGKRTNVWTGSIEVATAEGEGLGWGRRLFIHLILL